MTRLTHSDIMSALTWRYATKAYDMTRTISEQDLTTLLEAARLTPSSMGLQPWKFLVIKDTALRAKLREAAWGQPQVTDASHFIVLARRTTIDVPYVEHYLTTTAKVQGKTSADMDGLRKMLTGFVTGTPAPALAAWASDQVHIALGFLVMSAALMQIDASPMGGFDRAAFDQILGLPEQGLASVVVCGLGYRSPDDKYALVTKSRFCADEVIVTR